MALSFASFAPFASNRTRLGWTLAVVWLAMCAFGLWRHGAATLDLRFADPDASMRLVQVMHWLDGADWRDLREPRLDPPQGVWSHWSRLPDVPLAVVTLAAEPWLGRAQALGLAALLVPALLLLAELTLLAWSTRPLAGGRYGALGAVLLLPLAGLPWQHLRPGAVDHHGWQMLALTAMLGLVAHSLARAGRARLGRPSRHRTTTPQRAARLWGGVLGLVMGLALWVSAETLLWTAAAHLALAWHAGALSRRPDSAPSVAATRPATRQHTGYIRVVGLSAGLSLAVVAWSLLALAVPPTRWTVPACDALSPVLAMVASVPALVWWVFTRPSFCHRPRCAAALTLIAALTALPLLWPHCLSGFDPELKRLWLADVREMQSLPALWQRGETATVLALWLPPLLLGLCGRAPVWRLFLALALLGSVVAVRLLPFAHLLAVPLAAELARRLATPRTLSPSYPTHPVLATLMARLRFLAALVIVATLPWMAVLTRLPSFTTAPAPTPATVPFPAAAPVAFPCDLRPVAAQLVADGAPRPRLIASFIDLGPELLLRTGDAVIGAPYHRNVAGLTALLDILYAPDDTIAEQRLRARGVEMIVLCRHAPERRDYHSPDGRGTLVERLLEHAPPLWARPHPDVPDDTPVFVLSWPQNPP